MIPFCAVALTCCAVVMTRLVFWEIHDISGWITWPVVVAGWSAAALGWKVAIEELFW